uniref:Protein DETOXIFICATION n=3 Tax=Setaria italica TaxID=4555 RepID=K4A7P9_SETIT
MASSPKLEDEPENEPNKLIMKRLVIRCWQESRLLWRLAFPALLTEVFQFSIGFVTTGFVGHLGEVELAAVSVVENILDSSAYGFLFGMGSALETLSGQAVGAGQLERLGTYTQQSWIICGATAAALAPAYAFATPILHSFLRQPAAVARAAGPYARWAVPRLFAHAANIPLLMFFQAQSRVWVVASISGAVLGVHAALTYVAVRRLGFGLRGAAVVGDVSHWLVVAAQFAYMAGGRFPDAWKGFTARAFNNLGAFVKLSLGSAVMIWFVVSVDIARFFQDLNCLISSSSLRSHSFFCLLHECWACFLVRVVDRKLLTFNFFISLEFWYYTTLLVLVGLLKHAKLQLDIMSVCLNYEFMTIMVALGFSTAVGIRVSNELGANRPKETKFAVVVSVSTSIFMGAIFMGVFLIWRTSLPKFFSDSHEVIHGASRLGYLLAVTVFMSSIWPVLSGVAVGAGWQVPVAFINVGCYYLVGIPLGILFGFKLKRGAMGIWMGMMIGTFLQMVILFAIIFTTKWEKQAVLAEARMLQWGGKNEKLPLMKSPPADDQMVPAEDDEMLAQGSQKNIEFVRTD